MKRSHFILVSAVVGAMATLLLASCRKNYSGIPTSQLTNSAPFKANVENIYVESFSNTDSGTIAIVYLKTDDGRRVAIGGEKASPDMIGFVQSLRNGQTYTFPEVFLTYQKSREGKK